MSVGPSSPPADTAPSPGPRVPSPRPSGRRPPARKDKLAARVARQIGDEIVAVGWPVGQVLGSEAQLIERYGVSRAVLREAVRLVEHHTVASMRRGPAGGLVIRKPDSAAAVNAMIVYVEFAGVSVDEIMDARSILEPLAAGWAAERIDEAGIELLRETSATQPAAASRELSAPTQDELHRIVAKLNGNPVLELFIDVLTQLTARYARAAKDVSLNETQRVDREVDHAHRAIAAAIIAGNVGMAQHRAEEHLNAMSAWLISKYGGASTARQARIRARARPDTPRVAGTKLAEHVATQIRDEIVRLDWPLGTVIGSEAALQDRYNVSRDVLREAIRLLEHHSIATMRRGPGGGLVGTEPDPSATVEAMALLLDYEHVTVQQVRAVRDAIELACVVRVAGRIADPGVAESLIATVKMDPSLQPDVRVNDAAADLHTTIATLSDNRLLTMFIQILTRLWSRHVNESPADQQQLSNPEINARVQRAHEAIVEAMVRGDSSLARHRMLRHLTALTEWWQ